jgi:hypothetical protein
VASQFHLLQVQDGLRLYSAHKYPSSCCIPGPPSCLRSVRFLSLVAPFCGIFSRCVKPQFLSRCCRHLFAVRNPRTTYSSTFDRVSALHSLTPPRDGPFELLARQLLGTDMPQSRPLRGDKLLFLLNSLWFSIVDCNCDNLLSSYTSISLLRPIDLLGSGAMCFSEF